MQSNIENTTNWALTDEEFAAISGIQHQLRLLDGYPWLHPVGPYRFCSSGMSWPSTSYTPSFLAAARRLEPCVVLVYVDSLIKKWADVWFKLEITSV